MASCIGRVLVGRKASYRLLEVLKEPSVFKARTLPPSNRSPLSLSNVTYTPVVIKNLLRERELRTHQIPEIGACTHIRQLQDVIEGDGDQPKKMVLEWMDADLWQCRPHGKLANPKLPQIVAKSILEALVVFQRLHAVHTAFHEGVAKNNPNAQTKETRAPEVWKGLGFVHHLPAPIVAKLTNEQLVHWLLSRTLFGPRDKIIEQYTTAWCLAKIIRLIGPMEIPDDPKYKDDFTLAHDLAASSYKDPKTGQWMPFIGLGSLREELEPLSRDVCSYACIGFVEYLLVVDPAKRPTAEEALQHPFIKSIS
ncbi:uncharacterized protein K460DRAFT_388213 [Cucurbitaria berberidis CBS 394.84]|uniref:Protein kinase domain-containing protein n=1 Tax=Cucurbitaria berberidis CBS 394.84 TaxID=1168544 RepID=A0A9P4L6V5_9PLEO|nr:uncharacterized protein K460DRAFT_388213 [Cucurbitaria berberidis CBS 394.84]KAF1844371.1 hypothetical protein K460DRAFT_388213 [Cucurbitaria berberidis CBS 394.84]